MIMTMLKINQGWRRQKFSEHGTQERLVAFQLRPNGAKTIWVPVDGQVKATSSAKVPRQGVRSCT